MSTTITVQVTTECGNTWATRINCDLEGAKTYFMGQVFLHPDETPMGPVVEVVQITTEDK